MKLSEFERKWTKVNERGALRMVRHGARCAHGESCTVHDGCTVRIAQYTADAWQCTTCSARPTVIPSVVTSQAVKPKQATDPCTLSLPSMSPNHVADPTT